MLNRIPRSFPALSWMLDDIGRPAPDALAKAFGYSTPSVRRWIAADTAPLPVLIGLFWITKWGRSEVDAEAHNDAVQHAAMSRLLRDELIGAQRQIARLQRALDSAATGAANSPVYSSEYPPPMVREAGSN